MRERTRWTDLGPDESGLVLLRDCLVLPDVAHRMKTGFGLVWLGLSGFPRSY